MGALRSAYTITGMSSFLEASHYVTHTSNPNILAPINDLPFGRDSDEGWNAFRVAVPMRPVVYASTPVSSTKTVVTIKKISSMKTMSIKGETFISLSPERLSKTSLRFRMIVSFLYWIGPTAVRELGRLFPDFLI